MSFLKRYKQKKNYLAIVHDSMIHRFRFTISLFSNHCGLNKKLEEKKMTLKDHAK